MKRMLIASAIVLSLSACTAPVVVKSAVERDAAYAKAVDFCGGKDNVSYFFYKPQVRAFKTYCMDGRGREL